MNRSKRSYFFTAVLYPDCMQHALFVENSIKSLDLKWCAILHDKDIDKETGELKKAHWHIVFKTKNNQTLKSFAELLGQFDIAYNYIDTCNSAAMIGYLTHLGYPEKYQYSADEIFGQKEFYNEYSSGDDQIKKLFDACDDWLRDSYSPSSFSSLVLYLNSLGLLKLANSSYLISRAVQEYIYMKSSFLNNKLNQKDED